MASAPNETPGWVEAADLEMLLAELRPADDDPSAGLGPASVTWRVDREAAIFLGAGRALLLQLAHPWVAAAIAQHSRSLRDPIGRFHRTFSTVFTMVFGTVDQARAAARQLYRRHATITGMMPAAAGAFVAGRPYRANEEQTLRWVHATLIDTALMAYSLVLPPLTTAERERYWAESRSFAALFGILPAVLPASWAAFRAYSEAMWVSDTLSVGPEARSIAEAILDGAGTWVRIPAWYRALTTHLLPIPLQSAFGLAYGEHERRAAEHAIVWIRRTNIVLPHGLRYVGPYQEALARLSGQARPGLATRMLNRLWIGQPWIGGAAVDRQSNSGTAQTSGFR